MNDATFFLTTVAILAVGYWVFWHLACDLIDLYITLTTWLWPDDAYHTLPGTGWLDDETEVWHG